MSADASALQYDVFISYARADANLGAVPLDTALKRDFRVWRDVRDLDPAQDFTAELEQAIKASKYVIVCITPDVVRADSFVRREIAYANALKKPILVARFMDMLPPIHVFTHTWIDFFADWNIALEKLLRWLRGETIGTVAPNHAPLILPTDPYRIYMERLYADVVESLRVSIFSSDTITLRVVESLGDVPRKNARLKPKFVPYTLRETLEQDVTEIKEFASLHAAYTNAACDGRILLLGEPGAGKTTTLLAFARDAAAARLSDSNQPIPVFARVSGWDSRAETPIIDWLIINNIEIALSAIQYLIESVKSQIARSTKHKTNSSTQFIEVIRTFIESDDQYSEHAAELLSELLSRIGEDTLRTLIERRGILPQPFDLLDPQSPSLIQQSLSAIEKTAEDSRKIVRTQLTVALKVILNRMGVIALQQLIESDKALLLLDGLDELGGAQLVDPLISSKGYYDPRKRFLAALPRTGFLILSSRVEEYHQIGTQASLNCAVKLQGLDDEQMKLYLGDIVGLWEVVEADLILKDALRTPLLLALFRVGFEDAPNDARALHKIQKGDLNDLIFNTFIEKRWAFEQAHMPSVPMLYDSTQLKKRLAQAVIRALEDNRQDYTRLLRPDLGGFDIDRLIDLAKKLDLLQEAGREPVHLFTGFEYSSIFETYRFLHLRLRDAIAFPEVLRLLKDSDRRVRRNGIGVLCKLNDPRLTDTLIPLLKDSDIQVRLHAAEALGQFGDTSAVNPLIDALTDPVDGVRSVAATGLGNLGDSRAAKQLVVALSDPDWYVRECAAEALSKLPSTLSIQSIIADYHNRKIVARPRT